MKKVYGDTAITFGVVRGGGTVVFLKSGRGGHVVGENNCYVKLADILKKDFACSVFVADNPVGEVREDPLNDDFIFLNSIFDKPEVIYIGSSAGANYGSWYGHKYPQIKHMLLINPLLFMNSHRTTICSENFSEKIKYVIGEQDESARWVGFVPERDNVCYDIINGVGHCLPDEVYISTVLTFLQEVKI